MSDLSRLQGLFEVKLASERERTLWYPVLKLLLKLFGVNIVALKKFIEIGSIALR